MPFVSSDNRLGTQVLTETSTTQQHPLGTIVKGVDATYGEGEFIYLKGVGSTVVGSTAVFDSAFQTTLTVAASRGPVAVALSANVANQFGWYQVRGLAAVKTGTVAANAVCQTTATAGQVDDTTTATQYIDGMITRTADGTPSAGLAICAIATPCCNGR